MCEVRALREIADRFGLSNLEDCAHCVEGARDGIGPGELSDTACFSFYATKNLTCGERGAVVTDGDDLIEKLRLLRLHGMTKTAADRQREGYRHWDVTMLGWKYNMDNIQAAILIPQLRRLEAKLKERERLAQRYIELLADVPGAELPDSRPKSIHARHLFPIWVDAAKRDQLIGELSKRRIETVVNYRAIHLLAPRHPAVYLMAPVERYLCFTSKQTVMMRRSGFREAGCLEKPAFSRATSRGQIIDEA